MIASQLVGKISIEGAEKARADLQGIGKDSEKAGGGLKTFIGHMGEMAGGVITANLAGEAFGFVKDQLGDMLSAGMQANEVQASTEAVLRSTHGAAGMTAQSIGNLATSLMNLTGVDDDNVQSAENMLLTFTNIHSNIFPQVTKAALDLSVGMTQMGHSMSASDAAVMLGKALNNPLQGMTALNKAGVTFTAQEQQQIKTAMSHNDVLGAQKIIMGEVNNQFGGQAEAAGKANNGIKILTAQLDNAKQSIGQALVPALTQLASVALPVATAAANGLANGIQFLTTHGDQLKPLLIALTPIIAVGLVAAFVAWTASAGAAAAATIAATWPVLAITAAVAALAAGVIYAYTHWGWFKSAVDAARDAIGGILGHVGDLIHRLGDLAGEIGQAKDRFGDFLGVLGSIKDMVGDLIGDLENLGNSAKNAVNNLPGVGGLLQHVGLAEGGVLSEPVVGHGLRTGTLYTLAEHEPEAVTPLSKLGVSGGSGGSGGIGAGALGGSGGGGGVYIAPGVSLTIPVSIAGRNVGQVLLPDLVAEIRRGTGIRF